MRALHAAVDAGINLIDTADVYGDGHSERLIGRLLRERSGERLFVATKMGRRVEQTVANYRPEAFAAWIDRSRENLGVERLDLVQLHCPPTDVYYRPELFAALDELVAGGAIAHYGVSVEKVEEALKAIEYPGVASVQIIFNIVRQRPADRFLDEARQRDVGVLARVPLASGLLTGKLSRESRPSSRTTIAPSTATASPSTSARPSPASTTRPGWTSSRSLRALVPAGATLAQLALRWILMCDGVTAAIPGARSPEQARANAAAADLPPLPPEVMARIRELYEERAMPLVHQRW